MTKRFKSGRCTYCPAEATTCDHVFARKFFLERHRANLPQVPACKTCNSRKATLEHTLLSVLPFAGQQQHASEMLTTLVPPRLAKNLKLARKIRGGMSDAWMRDKSGLVLRGMTIPFPGEEFMELFGFIVRGVHRHHFGAALGSDIRVEVLPLTIPPLQQFFAIARQWNGAKRIKEDLGEGTFLYEGVQGIDNPNISLWTFEMLGGMQVADRNGGNVQKLMLGATVGPRQIEERAAQVARWRSGRGTTAQ